MSWPVQCIATHGMQFAYFTFSCAGDTLQASTLNYLTSPDKVHIRYADCHHLRRSLTCYDISLRRLF
jgi:hypothetical protein